MTEEIYDSFETQTALKALSSLTRSLPEPFILLGGWAVFFTSNKSYEKEHGVSYLGSRDVDIGFHIDPRMSVEELRQCTYSRAIEIIKDCGYCPTGSFRYCKFINKETGDILSEKEASGFPLHEIYYLYLDMMVDYVHPYHKKVFNCNALDEPILARVFKEGNGVTVSLGNDKVSIPPPYLLLATKLKAIPDRQKDDKILKDACDIYAIIWHSSEKYDGILDEIRREYPQECKNALEIITDGLAARAAQHLGIDSKQYNEVIRKLAL